MEYRIYRYHFPTAVHFGEGTADSTECTFQADTFFSAMCQEAVSTGGNTLQDFLDAARSGQFLVSDAFPYMRDEYYVPKPYVYIENRKDPGNSIVKKAYKNLKYVPLSLFDAYVQGDFPIDRTADLDFLGRKDTRTSAAVRGLSETVPYRVASYRFSEGCGLWQAVIFRDSDIRARFEAFLASLSASGIGGRRSSGYGRFSVTDEEMPRMLRKRLEEDYREYMTLSVSLPGKDELQAAMEGSSTSVVKRSGFVASDTYADTFRKKRDLYVFSAGSCFLTRFRGGIYDVSDGGNHPVYRYAMAMMMGVRK